MSSCAYIVVISVSVVILGFVIWLCLRKNKKEDFCATCGKQLPSLRRPSGRLSADMSDPLRVDYPITLPNQFAPYELPGQICPKCYDNTKYRQP